jgi:hypothetical protein
VGPNGLRRKKRIADPERPWQNRPAQSARRVLGT